ncbi:MAG: FecR domain-containing protein [Myxococcota bacterium]
MSQVDDDFSDDERQLLDRWGAPTPPSDFAARVAGNPRRGTSLVRYGVVAAALVLGVTGMVMRSRGDVTGMVQSNARSTIAIGKRAVVVAESGTILEYQVAKDWRGEGTGAALVEQRQGTAFYRVERGGTFKVHTVNGTIEVTGTCFTIAVDERTGVLVAVHEGSVVTQHELGGARESVLAGQSVLLNARGVVATQSHSASAAPHIMHSQRYSGMADLDDHVALMEQTAKLRDQVRALQNRLANTSNSERTYGLDHDELVRLADNCELSWDTPQVQVGTSPRLTDDDARALGLNAEQRRVVEEAMAEANARMVGILQATYVAVTGDENVAGVSATALLSEIEDKTSTPEMQRIYQRLAQERAGLPLKRAKPEGREAQIEELYRAYVTMGDDLQGVLAERLGASLAERIRDLRDGFSSRRHSSFGCP